ncbi:MAG: hypothetical protein M3082_05975 [Candidatus Dormibacteraeota bacterium]|nr:hypothetical protein [Candidatus Dormibacteraeota bacterium]
MIEHNAGSGWLIVTSPNASTQDNSLIGIKCVSTRNCWAVGAYQQLRPTVAGKTLVEHYS